MNRMIVTLAIVMLFISVKLLAETNIVYVPVDPQAYFGKEAEIPYAKLLEESKNLSECQASDKDPAGNWGAPTNGLQMSIRFGTNVVAKGQPIRASVILRNISSNEIVLRRLGEVPVEFVIVRDGKDHLYIAHPPRKFSGPSSFSLPPTRQIKYQINLEQYFDLEQAGKYSVIAERPSSEKKTGKITKVASAPAEIRVMEIPK